MPVSTPRHPHVDDPVRDRPPSSRDLARKMGVSWTVLASSAAALALFGGDIALASTSAAIYPPPVKARPGGALELCPDPAGLERFTRAVEASAGVAARDYGRVSLAFDLSNSDRSWRPEVRAMWERQTDASHPPFAEKLVTVTSATANGYRLIVGRACGARLLGRSLAITLAPIRTPRPGEGECQACRSTLFLVDRGGRALIYFVYP
jgi:hypothetical protein